jgi:hypothetical protein
MAGPLGALNYLPFAGGLAGGGGTAATTAAGGAGLAALGPWMLGATALSTVGGLIGGSQQANSQAQQTQLQGLFTKLAPINQSINYAGQELMASMAPYLGAQAAQTNLIGQSVYDMFTGARSKESQMAGLQTGITSQLAGGAIGQQEMAAKLRTAAEGKAFETQAGLVEKGADALGLQYTNLAKGLTDVGTNAANTRNAQVLAQTQTNLDIGKGLSLLKGQGELHFAKQRSDRAAALGAGGFA